MEEIVKYFLIELQIIKNGVIDDYRLYAIIFICVLFLILSILLLRIRRMNKLILKMKEKNQENSIFIKNVINNSPSMYSVKDRFGEIFLSNKSFADFLKINRDEIEGRDIKELFKQVGFHKEDIDRMMRDEIEVIKTRKEKLGLEEKFILPDGTEKWFYSNIVPLKMDLGLFYSLRVSTDITERKKAEVALNEAKLDAEKRSIEKGHFLASMSHEIRTPLNGIISMLEQINLKKNVDMGIIDKELEIMNISSKRLVEVVEDVLNLSKIEYGEIKEEVDEFDIRAEIKNCILLFAEKAKEKGIDVLTYVDKKVPMLVKGDLVKYHHILTNIFGNALKYTKEGYVLIELKLMIKESDKLIIRTVIKDTGIGIAKENHEDIFKRFSQVENSIKATNGIGLGLAIVRELLEKVGGTIALESEKDKGSVFIIDIPFASTRENEVFSVEDKEMIILSNRNEYLDNYIKNVKNIEGLNFITVDDISELDIVLDEKNLEDVFVIVDYNENFDKFLELRKMFEHRITFIKNERNKNFYSENEYVSREFLEDGLKKLLGFEKKEKNNIYKEKKKYDNPIKVLLVEDDVINREAFKIILESMGITNLITAIDGEEALNAFYNDSYDIVFMDLQLPKLSGFEIIEKIREYEAIKNIERSVIITLTANALEGLKEKCIDAGFDDYLTKPIMREKLYEKIDHFVVNKISQLDELKNQYYDNNEVLKKLLNSFVENIPSLIEELDTAIYYGDNDLILQKLHKVKGAIGNLREKNIIYIIENMENLAKKGESFEELYKKFQKDLDFLIISIKKEI